jgi:hypothetical protein
MPVKRTASPLRRLGALVALALAVLAAGESRAQTSRAAPDGIVAGKWVLNPYGFFGVEYDSNVFRRAVNIESDWIQRTTLGLTATIPVRNSAGLFEYTADRYAYQTVQFTRDWNQYGRAGWRWNLSSGDTITVGTSYTKGITNVQEIDPGGELTFLGQPYNLARWDLQIDRAIPRRQGYLIRISRVDMNWDPDEGEIVPFFDYRGWDARYEYRQPAAAIDWFIVYGEMRRFNHYRPRNTPGWELGVPFRKEESGSLQVGVRGFLGRGQPFFARIGYGEFEYTGAEPSATKFQGIVGELNWSLSVGARSSLELSLLRRPLPSTFPTYYLIDELRVNAERPWRQYSSMGLSVLLSRNTYGDAVAVSCNGEIRQDNRWEAEAYLDWLIHRKFGFRVAAAHYERTSNCDLADFKANVVTTGLTMGWF